MKSTKRYIPLDISLELTHEESPLVLRAPFLSTSSRQYYYETSKNGTRTIDASYGFRKSGQKFADVTHTILSTERIFTEQSTLKEYVEPYSEYLGPLTERSQGRVEHALGSFSYAIADSPLFSCVFTIKFIKASFDDVGGHEMIHGYYCDEIGNPLEQDDAADFIGAIQTFDRDPVRLREQRMASRRNAEKNFLAIMIVGKWPLDGSNISALKLIARGKTAGDMLVRINDETCHGKLSEIEASGHGEWEINCNSNENASGQFHWEADGTFRFQGKTATTASEINWLAYQVF